MDWEQSINHEIVVSNPEVDVRFYLSVDPGSYVAPHWHNSLEVVYVLEGWLQYQYNQSTIDVQAGEFIITNSKTIHAVLSGNNRAFLLSGRGGGQTCGLIAALRRENSFPPFPYHWKRPDSGRFHGRRQAGSTRITGE